MSGTDLPNQPAPRSPASSSWQARPGVARAIRFVVLMGPISAGAAAAIAANHAITVPSSMVVMVGRSLLIVAISTAVVWGVDRYARKLLPLAALMRLSLVFPDQAPSRFRSALRSGSSRRLERTLDDTRRHGLAKDPGDAARQVVQLISAIGDHDRRTRGHSERVRLFADLIGEELKLSKEERQRLQWGALLHDLGKLMVPGEILNKNGKPDPDEWKILQGHPAAGMDLIEPLREFLGEWAHAIGGHHEKWDGSGYPAGLRGSQIPRAAAIVAVADSFEVMTAVRSYKKAMPLAEARAELTRCAGAHFSPEVVRAFLSISLGSLRVVSGPLAALAHVPFLGNLAQIPGAVATAVPALASTAAMPVAAMVAAASLTVGGPATAGAVSPGDDPTRSEVAGAAAGAGSSAGRPSGSSTNPESTGPGSADGSESSQAGAAPELDASPSAGIGTDDGSPGSPGTGSAPTSSAGTPTTVENTTTTTRSGATTANTSVPVTTTAPSTVTTSPATTSPATTVPAPTTTAGTTSSFTISVATNSSRLSAKNLDGAVFGPGTQLYIFAMTSATNITYSYPGGTRVATAFLFDMMGSSGLAALPFTAPTNPGTYSVTAKATGPGAVDRPAVVATFTVS